MNENDRHNLLLRRCCGVVDRSDQSCPEMGLNDDWSYTTAPATGSDRTSALSRMGKCDAGAQAWFAALAIRDRFFVHNRTAHDSGVCGWLCPSAF
jgi:hypothetical protein